MAGNGSRSFRQHPGGQITALGTRMTAEEDKVQPVAKGGTGATTAAAARENLGVAISAETKQMFAAAGYPIE